mmetsp:Transcript_24696/g.48226  ORF Transcript_24696/g.48226 Transcript_24696/m.48226 type:complete len:208 (-) Transcript_24696:640-1263(-)
MPAALAISLFGMPSLLPWRQIADHAISLVLNVPSRCLDPELMKTASNSLRKGLHTMPGYVLASGGREIVISLSRCCSFSLAISVSFFIFSFFSFSFNDRSLRITIDFSFCLALVSLYLAALSVPFSLTGPPRYFSDHCRERLMRFAFFTMACSSEAATDRSVLGALYTPLLLSPILWIFFTRIRMGFFIRTCVLDCPNPIIAALSRS